MKHSIILCALATCSGLACYAQQSVRQYFGQVIDEVGKPISYASVAMLRQDSTIIGGGTTDREGKFAFSSAEEVKLLQISLVGYEQIYLDAQSFTSPIRLSPSSVMLQGVEAKVQRPRIKLDDGALVVGIEGTTLAYQPNMLGLLKQVPGLLISSEGEVGLISKGKLLVLLNGREVHSMDEVLTLDVKRIKTIRLETNPGARYRGDVSAVLHIRTAKLTEGLHLMLSQWLRINSRFSHSEEAQVGYTTPKVTYSAHINYGDHRRLKDQGLISQRFLITSLERLETTLRDDMSNKEGSLRVSADFTLSPKLSMGAKYNVSLSKYQSTLIDHSIAYTGDILTDEIISRGTPRDKSQDHHLNAFASYQGTDRLNLTLNADLFNKRIDRGQRTFGREPHHRCKPNQHGYKVQ